MGAALPGAHPLATIDVDVVVIPVNAAVHADAADVHLIAGISDCEITSGDDAIVLKSTADRPCKDVAITNCVLSTRCNALKLGTESNGGFENIAISNCTIYDTRLAGIAIEMVDGGILDRVTVSNITMNGVEVPIFIRLGDRARPFVTGGPRPPVGKLRNVSISDVQAVGAGKTGCAIAGLPDNAIENVTLDNIRLTFAGGGKASDAHREVPRERERISRTQHVRHAARIRVLLPAREEPDPSRHPNQSGATRRAPCAGSR